MFASLRHLLIVPLLIAGLLLPKVSAAMLLLNPNILAIVICTGTEMVTIHIGADGTPVEVSETGQTACVLADPNALPAPAHLRWSQAPKSYRADFIEIAQTSRSQAELGLLPDLRGPPVVI